MRAYVKRREQYVVPSKGFFGLIHGLLTGSTLDEVIDVIRFLRDVFVAMYVFTL